MNRIVTASALVVTFVWMAVCLAPDLAFADASARPKLRTSLSRRVVVPGQIVELEVTILVPTWMPKPPQFPTFELPNVSVRSVEGSSRPASERIGRDTWSGVTRTYQLSPLVVGKFRIPAQKMTVTFADPETRRPIVAQLRMAEIVFEGRAPEGAEDLDPFIAAMSLTLTQTIEGDPENLEPGDSFGRVVTAEVIGTSAIFLPPLIPSLEAEGLRAYAKEPVFQEKSHRGRTTGERVESVTYVAEAGGRFRAAPVRLRWWNLRTKEIELAEIPAFEIVSRGPPPAAPSSVEPRRLAPWVVAAGIVAVALGVAVRWLGPGWVERHRRRREAWLASEAFAFSQVMAALRARHFGDAVRWIERWSVRLPNAIESDRAEFFESLAPMSAALYGQSGESPSNQDWSRARRSLQRTRRHVLGRDRQRSKAQLLPSINP